MVGAVAALAGSLDDFPAPPLLRLVARARHSGTLHVATANQPVAICFEDGVVTYAGPADVASARAALLATGLVGAEVFDELVADGRPAGAPAPATGASQAGLDEALHDLAVSTVFELLLPSAASFRFEAGRGHRLAGLSRFDAERLVGHAAARLEAWRLIADVIPSTSVVLRLADLLPVGTEQVSFDREEWPVLAAVDGRRDVAAIISHTGLSAFGVCGALRRLVILGVAEPVGA